MRTLTLHRTVLTDIISATDKPGEDHQWLKQVKAECSKRLRQLGERDKHAEVSASQASWERLAAFLSSHGFHFAAKWVRSELAGRW